MKKNAGYEIIKEEYYTRDNAIVLGKRGTDYVTWEYTKHNDNYFWGHYFTFENKAIHDFYTRLAKETDPDLIPF